MPGLKTPGPHKKTPAGPKSVTLAGPPPPQVAAGAESELGEAETARPIFISEHVDPDRVTEPRRPWALAAIGVTAFVAGAAWLLRGWLATAPAPVTAGSLAPAFEATTVDASRATRALSDYAGHPVLLNFWATWCQPCREEMASFEQLYRDDGPRGLRIVAVSVDDPGADPAIRAFVSRYGLTFDVLHDRRSRARDRYQVRGVPETFFISADGRIVGTQFVRDWASGASRAMVDSLLFGGRP